LISYGRKKVAYEVRLKKISLHARETIPTGNSV
jgi:hypothetical protein